MFSKVWSEGYALVCKINNQIRYILAFGKSEEDLMPLQVEYCAQNELDVKKNKSDIEHTYEIIPVRRIAIENSISC
jgi:hypothetical protein